VLKFPFCWMFKCYAVIDVAKVAPSPPLGL